MPEEKYGSTRRQVEWSSSGKWRSRLLRWSVWVIGWTTYILYRSFVVGQIKYDPHTGKLIIRPRNMWTKRIALILKIAAMSLDNFGLHYLFFAGFPLFSIAYGIFHPSRTFKDLIESLVFQIAFWNIGRLYYCLSSLSWNRSFVVLVNEVIHMMSLIADTLGPLLMEGAVLLIIFVVQFDLTVLQIIDYCHDKVVILALRVVLLTMFYNVYVVYQLILLAWIATFNRFLEAYYMERMPSREQRQQLQQLFRLYSRVSNAHQNIMVLWLPVATMLFSSIVVLVAQWASVIYCIFFIDRMNAVEKWHAFLREHLGGSVAPLLRILLIGLCNDRLAQMQRYLSLQLLIIDLRHSGGRTGEDLNGEIFVQMQQTCFNLQLRAQPIRNQIISIHQVCGCPFVLEFFFCTLLNALNTVQYGIANGINLYNS
ncbi:hypothetical protein KR038_006526 [Drosophila bunnanda]|nr:hypothetical protein KR038_006526 [Drosophila bunnanda]